MDIIAIQERETIRWYIIDGKDVRQLVSTTLDANRMSSVEISKMISLRLIDRLPQIPSSLTIYTTHSSPRNHYVLEDALLQHFDCLIEIKGYYQSVAEALCGNHSGIIAFIGETSEVWKFDGSGVTIYIPSLGHVFGDKGSCTVLGKTLISAMLRGQVSKEVSQALYTRLGIDAEWLLHQAQKNQLPQKFLSSLLPFITEHKEDPSVKALIYATLEEFLKQDIKLHTEEGEEVHFIGEMTSFYDEALVTICQRLGFRVGKILTSATDSLLSSHTTAHK